MALLVCSTNQRKIWCSCSLLWVIFLRFFSRVNCVCGHTIQSYYCKSDQHSELISENFYKNYFTEIYGIFHFENSGCCNINVPVLNYETERVILWNSTLLHSKGGHTRVLEEYVSVRVIHSLAMPDIDHYKPFNVEIKV